MKVSEVLELFVGVSALFRARFQKPLWERYPMYLEDPLHAILIFLDGYAFERRGRNPAYSHAAVEAIQRAKESSMNQDLPQQVWKTFSGLLDSKGLNKERNPIFHKTGSCRCVWCIMGSQNIILWSKKAIAEGGVEAAWKRFKAIRGVGDKIASFFLRDLVVHFELSHNLDRGRNRWLLQPVDVWVRRGVFLLSGNEKDDEVAKWLVENCEEPELVNQGIWYFGAQIAESDLRLRKSIKDPNYARTLCQGHIASLEAAVKAVEGWHDPRS
jgi:hypothetical protein